MSMTPSAAILLHRATLLWQLLFSSDEMTVALAEAFSFGGLVNILGHYASNQILRLCNPSTYFGTDLDKAVAEIREAIASLQTSKLKSAYQYIRLAMDDLMDWYEKLDGTERQLLSMGRIERLRISPEESEPFYARVKDRLRQAEAWATEAFNDSTNCSPSIRVAAFDVRLFCITIEYWENPEQWIRKWRLMFSFLFQDRTLVMVIFHLYRSSLFSAPDDMETAGEHIRQLIVALGNACLRQVLIGTSTMKEIKEFFANIDQKQQLQGFGEKMSYAFSPGVASMSSNAVTSGPSQFGPRGSFICWDFGRIYRSLSDSSIRQCESDDDWLCRGITGQIPKALWYDAGSFMLTPHKDTLFINLKGLAFLTSTSNGTIWAINSNNQVISIDQKNPNNTKIINGDHKWQCIGGPCAGGTIYGKAENQSYLSVFDTSSAAITDARISLPAVSTDFVFVATEHGIIFGFDVTNRRLYALVASKWFYFDPSTRETRETFLSSSVVAINAHCAMRMSMLDSDTILLSAVLSPDSGNSLSTSSCTYRIATDGTIRVLENSIEPDLVRLDTTPIRHLFAWRLVIIPATSWFANEKKRLGIQKFLLRKDGRGSYDIVCGDFYEGTAPWCERRDYDRNLCAMDEERVFISIDLD